MAKKDERKLLEEARKRFSTASSADRENRRKAAEDLEFVHQPGAQWDLVIRTERGLRPCFEFNKLRVTIKRVVNDIRANRPQGKVRAVEDNDKDTASVIEGLIRNIWNGSDGDAAIDNAAEYQVAGGMGAWRIVTEYSEDTSWDQDIKIKGIRNPFSVYADPSSLDPMKRDARYWFVTSRIAKSVFEQKYGDKPALDFEADEFDDDEDWEDEDSIRIAEYWYQKPVMKTLALLSDGSTVDTEKTPATALTKQNEDGSVEQITVVRTRQVHAHEICMVVMSGDRILEGPVTWAGSMFPFVIVYGESVVMDGKVSWFGLTRFAKDAQRAYNVSRTAAIESVALAPQSKFWATPTQAQGNVELWNVAHKENLPYMIYNPDPATGGQHPQRMGGADVPVALIQQQQVDSDDIKATTGIFDNSLGQKANESSGVAIRARQAQGEIATFNYSDNIARAIRRTWEILIDLVPKVYDTQRSVRILGTDGAESYVEVNAQDPQTGQVANDLSRGKFDVTITTGPNFSTQRQEAAEVYMGMAQANPAVFGVAGDLIFKAMDLPYSEDIADRMKAMLPPQIQQMMQEKQKGSKAMPPEVMAVMAQAQQAMQMVQQQGQAVQQAAQELDRMKGEVQADKAAADKAKSDVQIAIANLKVQEANLGTAEAQFKQLVAETQQKMQDQQGSAVVASDREFLSAQIQSALSSIQQQSAEFMTNAAGIISQIQATANPQVIVSNPPKNKLVRVKRINGELVGTVEES